MQHVIKIDAGKDPLGRQEGVAVLATSTWAAMQGRKALRVTWTEPSKDASSVELERRFHDALAAKGTVIHTDGDVDAALASAAHTIDAVYELPFLAHVPMEPVHYLADVRADRAELWGSTQVPGNVAARVAAVTGLKPDAITVHLSRGGGGFGRRLMDDYAAEAATLSKSVGRPVKVIWTRDDDIQHDYYRPAGHHRIRAGLSAAGKVTAWSQHLANTSRYDFARNGQPPQQSEMYPEDFPVGCIPNTRLEYSLVLERRSHRRVAFDAALGERIRRSKVSSTNWHMRRRATRSSFVSSCSGGHDNFRIPVTAVRCSTPAASRA